MQSWLRSSWLHSDLGFLARGFGVALGVGSGGGVTAAGAVAGSDGVGIISGLSTVPRRFTSDACA